MIRRLLLLLLVFPFAAAAEEVSIPLTMVRGVPLAPVTMNGSDGYWFAVDTSISRPVVDLEVARALQLQPDPTPVQVDAPGFGPMDLPIAHCGLFKLGDLPEQPASLAVVDLTPLAYRLATPVAGLVPAQQPGYETTLDFAAGQWILRSLNAPAITDASADTIKFVLSAEGAVALPIIVEDAVTITVRLDALFEGHLALPQDQIKLLPAWVTTTSRAILVDGEHASAQLRRLGRVKAGGLTLMNPVALVQAPARLGTAGLLSGRITLNYEQGLLRIEPGASLAAPPWAGYGLRLSRYQDQYWTVDVVADGPAAEAGIEPGDLLIAADNQPLANLPAASVAPMLTAVPDTVRIFLFQRAEFQKSVTLTARLLL